MTMADRIAIMDAGQIRQVGSPDEIYEQPSCRYTAEFIGTVNLFEGKLAEDQIDHCTVATPDMDRDIYIGHGITGVSDMPVAFAIRPEKIDMSKTDPQKAYNAVEGIIEDIAYLGSHSVYHVRLKSGKRVQVTLLNEIRWSNEQFDWDDPVWIYWDNDSGVVLTS